MASTTSRQPPWFSPQGSSLQPHLKVYNSLTRSKVPFVPIERDRITWYACGPTVYDDAHLGHARNYVSTDILRRILRDYFKFDVRFVMNITDVDDKIILRGRQRYLYDEYKTKHRYIEAEVMQDVLKAWHMYIRKNLPRMRLDPPPMPSTFTRDMQLIYGDVLKGLALVQGEKPGDKEAKVKMHLVTAQNTAKALTADLKTLTPDAFYNLANDAMCAMLDAQLGQTIKGTDHDVFTKLTQEFEDRFFHDMRDLNVIDPDEIVRVTESGEDIAQFVDKIVKNKFAYATPDGSVYFDIKAFEAAGNPYARLEPWNRGDKSLQEEGEGQLSNERTDGKRSDVDFALWKSTKPGEPSWDSPWGPGRPGWHIECSAMASAKLGNQMDIHSGGIDLAFPHHDNELAQSEAFWTEGKPMQWVNYFLHMGHLSIQGSKMSKSLKNFTTIRAALDRREWTSRGLRIVFLLGSWRDGIEITDALVKEGSSWEDRVDNFFINVIETLNNIEPDNKEPVLKNVLSNADTLVRQHLLDSFYTPGAMTAISQLITEYNSTTKADLTFADHYETGIFVSRLVNIFGLNGDGPPDTSEIGWQGIEIPDAAKQYVYPLSKIRDELRQAAIAKAITPEKIQAIISTSPSLEEPAQIGRPRPSYARAFNDFKTTAITTSKPTEPASSSTSKDINKEILALCDRVRDVDLWNLNIYLEDRDNAPALVRPVTEGLRAARREKEEKTRARDDAKRQRETEARAKLEKGRIPAEEMFRPPNSEEYSRWDAEGLPTHARDGVALAPSRVKKLRKDWDRQRKAHEAFMAAVRDGSLSLGGGSGVGSGSVVSGHGQIQTQAQAQTQPQAPTQAQTTGQTPTQGQA